MSDKQINKFDLEQSTIEDKIKNNKNIQDPQQIGFGMENSICMQNSMYASMYASMQQSAGYKQFLKSLDPLTKLVDQEENIDDQTKQERDIQNINKFINSKYFDIQKSATEIQNLMKNSNLYTSSQNQKDMQESLVTKMFKENEKWQVLEAGKGMAISFTREDSKQENQNKNNKQIEQSQQQQIKEQQSDRIKKIQEKVKFQLQHIGSVQSLDGQIEDNSKSEDEQDEEETQSKEVGSKEEEGCNCKRTKCLKLYCECFRNGVVCTDKCRCNDCKNTDEKLKERSKAMEQLINKNPDAFNPKIEILGNLLEKDQNYIGYKKGCNCKKTFCRKKYCECFNAGVKCTYLCKCENCMNGNCEEQNHQNAQILKGMDKTQNNYRFMSSESDNDDENTKRSKKQLKDQQIQNQILNANNVNTNISNQQQLQDQRVLRKTQQRLINRKKDKEREKDQSQQQNVQAQFENQQFQNNEYQQSQHQIQQLQNQNNEQQYWPSQQYQQQSQQQQQQQKEYNNNINNTYNNQENDEEDLEVQKIMDEPIQMQNFESN